MLLGIKGNDGFRARHYVGVLTLNESPEPVPHVRQERHLRANLNPETPMTNAEALGAQVAINNIEKMLGELKSFKNPPPVRPAD